MAISPIGNLTYINQNLQVGVSMQANTQHRADIANLANMQDFKEKLEGIEEVRKLEENEAINPDADSQKQRGEDEQRRRESLHKQHEEQQAKSDHLLDIKA